MDYSYLSIFPGLEDDLRFGRVVEVDLQLGEVKLLHTDLCAGDAGALDQGAVLGRSQVCSLTSSEL